ncbi:MAG: adenosine deaminase [Acidobacteriota bacterium]|nr:adenosine deaminase [Acidobacteriota bacterium]
MTIYRLVLLFSALTTCLRPCACATRSTESVDQLFNILRKSPPELYAFLLRMPKGADLHNHLSGAVYAETFLQEAAAAHVCINRQTLSFAEPSATAASCGDNQVADAASLTNSQLASDLIDSLSMRDFVPGRESPHDHFFDTFSKFGAVSHLHDGDYLAEVVNRAAEQNESYLELMALSAGSAISNLGRQIGLDADFEITRQKLLHAGLERQAAALKSSVDELERSRIAALKCESQPDSPPCRVTVRYIFQVLRNSPKEQVFAQVLAGFMLASADPRVVAVNFVQPEDGFTSMHDYHLQMQMVDFAKRFYPNVHISLHAGELASGMVPPEGLRFHIREAAEIGHAERIGHGVDIMYENNSLETLQFLHDHHIDIEINLTSNDAILGVKGYDHPFPVYRKYGVPVTLSTDDEGVSRTHLTQEYQRAVLTYSLTYPDVKQIVRNSLEYAFLPGQSFWRDSSYRTPAASCATGRHTDICHKFLTTSEKARLQADLEDRFAKFESSVRSR